MLGKLWQELIGSLSRRFREEHRGYPQAGSDRLLNQVEPFDGDLALWVRRGVVEQAA